MATPKEVSSRLLDDILNATSPEAAECATRAYKAYIDARCELRMTNSHLKTIGRANGMLQGANLNIQGDN